MTSPIQKDKIKLWKILAGAVVAGICGLFLADAFRAWNSFDQGMPQISSEHPPRAAASVSHEGRPGPSHSGPVSTEAIVERNIFGGSTKALDKPQPKIELEAIPLAEQSRQLSLKGTIVNSKISNWAIIEDQKTRRQGLYTEGDTIRDIAITSILRNNVVIQGDKGEEILSLDREIRNAVKSLATKGSP